MSVESGKYAFLPDVFIEKLVYALADEVRHHGSENCSYLSLEVLEEANALGLLREYDRVNEMIRKFKGD